MNQAKAKQQGTHVRRLAYLGALVLGIASCSTSGGAGMPADGGVLPDGSSLAPTQLPVDCRLDARKELTDQSPICIPDSNNKVGTGVTFESDFGEGFMDNGHIIFTAGPVLGGNWAVFSLDPSTQVRTAVSGSYQDPRLGTMTVGTGPNITYVYDAAKGPDGAYYFLVTDSMHPTSTWGSTQINDSVIMRVDPKTGNRTEVLDFAPTTAACMTASGRRLYPNDALIYSKDNQDALTFDIGTDGTYYVSVQGGQRGGGVVAFKNGRCRIISLYDSMGTDTVGTGAELDTGGPVVIRFAGSHLYVIPSAFYAIIQIDIATGQRMIISTAETYVAAVGTGPGIHPDYMQVASDGSIWTSGGGDISVSSLTRVDPKTGNRIGYEPYQLVAAGGNAHVLYGIDLAKSFAYFNDRTSLIGVLEYSTGNFNILAE